MKNFFKSIATYFYGNDVTKKKLDCIQDTGESTRFQEEKKTLRELAKDGNIFCKFSQSKQENKSSAEDVFIEYIPGKLVIAEDPDKKLSFVKASDIAQCSMYGDQITVFDFELSELERAGIADNSYKTMCGIGEHETEKLIVKENKCFSEIDTFRWMIQVSDNEALWHFFIDSPRITNQERFSDMLKRLEYIDAYNLMMYIKENYDTTHMSVFDKIRDNIDEIIEIVMK